MTPAPLNPINDFAFPSVPWDWRGVKGAVTSVKNQGGCGSCYAFAVVGVTESMHMITKGSYYPNLSEQQIVDCSNDNNGCGGGWMWRAMRYIRDNGLVGETTYPYKGVQETCKFNSGPWKVASYTSYTGCSTLRTVVRKGPVSVGVAASGWGGYASGLYQCNPNNGINHAVMLVGYTSLRHWIIKNSWGKSWGEDGYMTIDRNADCKICSEIVGATVN